MAIVRVSQGFFDVQQFAEVSHRLEEGASELVPALQKLDGLLHYYVAIDPISKSMVNVSVWTSLEKARQMDTLAPMLSQREVFEKIGVRFQPIRNYDSLWTITP